MAVLNIYSESLQHIPMSVCYFCLLTQADVLCF